MLSLRITFDEVLDPRATCAGSGGPGVRNVARPVSAGHLIFRRMFWWQVVDSSGMPRLEMNLCRSCINSLMLYQVRVRLLQLRMRICCPSYDPVRVQLLN